ncbi:MAG: response regulator transcription factor [Anaerolineae bacterium]|nr:response regulator transcription factor [Anaerolineae bacterium]
MTVTTPAKILVVDDDDAIRLSLEDLLDRDGYQVRGVASGEQALVQIADERFDLVLLDLRMQGIGGIEVLTALREKALDVAVIVLTAHGSMDTAIDALKQGAHDYLLKPTNTVSLRESVRTALVKREREQRQRALLLQVQQSLTANLEEIRAAVVQSYRAPEPTMTMPTPENPQALMRGGLVVDLAQHIIDLDGHRLELTPTEFDMLAHLAQEAPNVVDSQALVRHVLGYECDRFEASEIVRHHIHRIRHKATACTGRSDLIRTVRGVGYALIG